MSIRKQNGGDILQFLSSCLCLRFRSFRKQSRKTHLADPVLCITIDASKKKELLHDCYR